MNTTQDIAAAKGRAFGKAILLGEHAVVHGTEAVAMSLPIGVNVTAVPCHGPLTISLSTLRSQITIDDNSLVGRAIGELVRTLGLSTKGARLEAEVEIPIRAGLGSSAAIAAASARALVAFHEIEASGEELFNAVQASERVFHGNPSGIDATMALRGGIAVFSKAEGARPVDASPPPLLVVHSGESGDTRATVAHFAEKMKQRPREARSRLDRIAGVVERGISALERDDLTALGEAMSQNHEILSWFGVSTKALDRIVGVALDAGALGAKLTGGGGGGCALVLVNPGDTGVASSIEDAGFSLVLG